MSRWLLVALAGCSFHHGAAPELPPPQDAPISDGPADGDLDARVWMDALATSTPAFVQGTGTTSNSTNIIQETFSSPETAHDLNLVVVSWTGAAATTRVSDFAGNTYTEIGSPIINDTQVLDVWYAADIQAAIGANIVTATFNAVVATPEIRILEYRGIALGSPVDVTGPGVGNNKNVTSGSVTTTHAVDMLVGCEVSADTVKTDGNGYTEVVRTGGDVVEDMVVTSTGSYDASATLYNQVDWSMRIVALKGVP